MEYKHKEALRLNRVLLTGDVILEPLWPHMVQCGLFTDHMMDCINSEKTPLQRNQKLITDLARRGPKAFDLFIRCLNLSDQQHIANALLETVARGERTGTARQRPVTAHNQFPTRSNTVQPARFNPTARPQSATHSTRSQAAAGNAYGQAPTTGRTQGGGLLTNPTDDMGRAVKEEPMDITAYPDEEVQKAQMNGEKLSDKPPGLPGIKKNTDNDQQYGNQATVTQSAAVNDVHSHGYNLRQPRIPVDPNIIAAVRNEELVYKMASSPPGVALIINNSKFHGPIGLSERIGSDQDRDRLYGLFRYLGYETVLLENQTSRDMMQNVKSFSSDPSLRQVDSCIVAILSHGKHGSIYASDCGMIPIDKLMKEFDGDHCPGLKGKPKLFLLQACRGEQKNTGFNAADGVAEEEEEDTVSDGHKTSTASLKKGGENFADSLREKLPSGADMLVAYATVPGEVSWRNSVQGSWFIQAFCDVIRENCTREDLLSMMTMVNNKVATHYESECGSKQMPQPINQLRKKWFFKASPLV